MKISGEKVFGTFLERPNRFEALVEIEGEINLVHVPNTGRMSELLHFGTRVVLVKSQNPNRKTKYSLIFVYKQDHLICINSILANKVFEEGVRNGTIDLSKGEIIREYTYGKSRIDFLIEGEDKTLIEIKCCTYEEDNHARFPDAPTERGRKHINELMKASKEGYKAEIIILAFMDYVEKFSPNYKIDKEFGELLKLAYDNGVTVRVFRCKIQIEEVSIDKEIELLF
jgi:sugar fermentation stimulation protein A